MAVPFGYQMTLSLNVLNHLGLNLYSNVPAVLAEVVANSWDADAKNVEITITPDAVEIFDDGLGLGADVQDVNARYLTVGYERRKQGEAITPELKRPVMGRKGIGKLSLFSVANTVEVHSVKDGRRHSFRMNLQAIRDQITSGDGVYEPSPVEHHSSILNMEHGTLIHITDFKRNWRHTDVWLKKRLARRFSIIGAWYDFGVKINGKEITVVDRDYFHRLQYIWTYGDRGKEFQNHAHAALRKHERRGDIPEAGKIWGWIGTVAKSGVLKEGGESINKITILMRGKLAQEDILSDFGESGVYSHFLIGEINADFLDADEDDDIATSSRQRILEDDPRYLALKNFIHEELKHIQARWTELRNNDGVNKAKDLFPAIDKWYQGLSPDYRKSAKRLFGKINQLPIDSERDRRNIIKNSVVAFESLKYKQNLQKLEDISLENLPVFAQIVGEYDDLEATLYHQITRSRLQVIDALQEKVDSGARERVIQEHIFNHLWLLDKDWERIETTAIMEQRVASAFGDVDAGLTHEQLRGRVDIRYRTTAGKHIIIELKKPDVAVSTGELIDQFDKYRIALQKLLDSTEKSSEMIEVVCIVGRPLKDWDNDRMKAESIGALREKNARVVMYDTLIENAQSSYRDYLNKRKEAGRVYELIQELEEWEEEA